MDDEADLGDVGVGRAPVLLLPQLDDGIGLIVQQPLDAAELAFGVVADAVGDLGILALDDRPHASLWPSARALGESDARARVASRLRVYAASRTAPRPSRGRLSAHARPRSPRRPGARPDQRLAQAASVAPVVTTSSTSRTQRPATTRGSRDHRECARHVRRTLARGRARTGRPSPRRARARGRTAVRDAGAATLRDEGGLVVAARRSRSAWTGTGTTRSAPTPTRAQRRATAAPSGSASLCSPPYFRSWSAARTGPANGAHHSSCRSGAGMSAGMPIGVRRASRAGRRAPAGTRGRAARPRGHIRSTTAGSARSSAARTGVAAWPSAR